MKKLLLLSVGLLVFTLSNAQNGTQTSISSKDARIASQKETQSNGSTKQLDSKIERSNALHLNKEGVRLEKNTQNQSRRPMQNSNVQPLERK